MPDGIFIQDRFTIVDEETGVPFSDALIFPLEQYETLSPEEIDRQKQERFDNWKAQVSTAEET